MVSWMQTKKLRKGEFPMAQFVNLNPGSLRELHIGN